MVIHNNNVVIEREIHVAHSLAPVSTFVETVIVASL